MTRYVVQPGKSTARIRARSSLHPVESVSFGIEGFLEIRVDGGGVDLREPARGRLQMPVSQLTSGNLILDREMRRRVDARRFPVIEGDLTRIEVSDGDGRYLVTGEVTFHGVTRAYTDEMTLSWPSPEELCLEGQHVFDIRDFGVEPPRIMMMRVYPDVAVQVRLVARAGD